MFRITGDMKMATQCRVIDLQNYRAAKIMREAGERQGELAGALRRAAADRAQLARILDGAQRDLTRVADSYTVLLDRLARERDFRDACLAAAELTDLDEMIRRRDELRGEYASMRGEYAKTLPPDAAE